MRNSILVALALALSPLATTAEANFFIDVGDHLLLPNQAGQTISIYVNAQGGEAIQALAFRATLGDGGALVGGLDVGPTMTGDIIGPGRLFETNHSDLHDQSVYPMILDLETLIADRHQDLVVSPGSHLLGTITFDTTGFGPGSVTGMPLFMVGGLGGDAEMLPYSPGNLDFPLTIENGSITIVPEPGSVALASFSLLGMIGMVYRRRRRAARL
jgi:hypothetical protein